MRHEDQLAEVTCWLGHRQDQEQWIHRRVTLADGREADQTETLVEGKIVEETSDF